MTPRERAIAALRFQPYEGPVPHTELEFQLGPEMFGEAPIPYLGFDSIPRHKRRDELVRNARFWIRVAEAFDWSIITGIHWLPVDAQVETFSLIREMSGDRYMLSTGLTGTMGIPSSEEIGPLISKIADDYEGVLADFEALCQKALDDIRILTANGAELVFLLTDYAFKTGTFFSPRMFRRLVSPFSVRLVQAIHEGGAFAVQHSDGNLMGVMDQMLEWGLDGLHSIDPMAGMDIRTVRERVGNRLCLFGNVDCSLVQAGTHEEIEASARYCLEHGPWNGTGYVYNSSNCIFEGVPPENYRAMLSVRDAWTREHPETGH